MSIVKKGNFTVLKDEPSQDSSGALVREYGGYIEINGVVYHTLVMQFYNRPMRIELSLHLEDDDKPWHQYGIRVEPRRLISIGYQEPRSDAKYLDKASFLEKLGIAETDMKEFVSLLSDEGSKLFGEDAAHLFPSIRRLRDSETRTAKFRKDLEGRIEPFLSEAGITPEQQARIYDSCVVAYVRHS